MRYWQICFWQKGSEVSYFHKPKWQLPFFILIYLTAIGLTPGGSSTVHIYTQTIQRTTQWNRIPRKEHTRVVPKIMSNNFFHANWEQLTKESKVVDETSCCVILECLVTSIPCITWPVSLLTKWPTICRFASVLSSNFWLKRNSLLQKFTRDFSVLMEVCAWVRAVFEDGWNILKMEHEHPRWAMKVPSAAKVMGSLLGCRGVDFGRIPGTWANHHCCSLCPDTAQAPSCIAR